MIKVAPAVETLAGFGALESFFLSRRLSIHFGTMVGNPQLLACEHDSNSEFERKAQQWRSGVVAAAGEW